MIGLKRDGVGKVGNLAYFINQKEKIGEKYVVKINPVKKWSSTYPKKDGTEGSSVRNVGCGLEFRVWTGLYSRNIENIIFEGLLNSACVMIAQQLVY